MFWLIYSLLKWLKLSITRVLDNWRDDNSSAMSGLGLEDRLSVNEFMVKIDVEMAGLSLLGLSRLKALDFGLISVVWGISPLLNSLQVDWLLMRKGFVTLTKPDTRSVVDKSPCCRVVPLACANQTMYFGITSSTSNPYSVQNITVRCV